MLEFIKMNGIGNDYIFLDLINNKIKNIDFSKLSIMLSNRNYSIGSDGIILIDKSEIADFKMSMYNSDGSIGKMCGNGIRCLAKYVYESGLTTKENLTIETLAGVKNLTLEIEDCHIKNVIVDMGEPIYTPELIPVKFEFTPVKDLIINSYDKTFNFTCVSMGNPHAVTVIDNIDEFDIEKYAPPIQQNKIFTDGVNLEFIEIIDRENIKMRVYERGSGETMACGTGACASVVSCILNNYTKNEVKVILKGGNLNIWLANNNHIYMKGPACISYYGKVNLEELYDKN